MNDKEFEMTEAQYNKILESSKPTPVMYLTGGESMFKSPQENANQAWENLGEELGFKYMTVKPSIKGDKFFLAEPKKEES